jgi:hypothetical protein
MDFQERGRREGSKAPLKVVLLVLFSVLFRIRNDLGCKTRSRIRIELILSKDGKFLVKKL